MGRKLTIILIISLVLLPCVEVSADDFLDVFDLYDVPLDYTRVEQLEQELAETEEKYLAIKEEMEEVEYYNECLDLADFEGLFSRHEEVSQLVKSYANLSSNSIDADVSELVQYDSRYIYWNDQLNELSSIIEKCSTGFEKKELSIDFEELYELSDSVLEAKQKLGRRACDGYIGELKDVAPPVKSPITEEFGFQFGSNDDYTGYNSGCVYGTAAKEEVTSVLSGIVTSVSDDEVVVSSSDYLKLVYKNMKPKNISVGEYVDQNVVLGTANSGFMFCVYLENINYNPRILLHQY